MIQQINKYLPSPPPGLWPSLLSANMVASCKDSINFPMSCNIKDESWIFWQEQCVRQSTRIVLRGRNLNIDHGMLSNPICLFTPDNLSLGSQVHAYGGRAFAVIEHQDKIKAVVINYLDQSLYVCHDLLSDKRDWNLLMYHKNYHLGGIQLCPWGAVIVVEYQYKPNELPENFLIFCDWYGHHCIIHQGEDFYAGLQFSPDYCRLAFISWRRPYMPWNQSILWSLQVKLLSNRPIFCKCNKPLFARKNTSVFQPMFDTNNLLYYVSDVNGYANLYNENCKFPLLSRKWEFSIPQWQLDVSTYTVISVEKAQQDKSNYNILVACAADHGVWRLGYMIYTKDHSDYNNKMKWYEIDLLGAHITQIVAAGDGFAALIMPQDRNKYLAYFSLSFQFLYSKELHKTPSFSNSLYNTLSIVESSTNIIKSWTVITPKIHQFKGKYGSVQGFWYLPSGLGNHLPPIIILVHGGPNSQTNLAYRAKYQYWLSRGFALFDINYSGSTGFGRKYRQRLDKRWGIVDRDDCLDGLKDLLRLGWVDSYHAFISGSSAGGLTVLNCLCYSNLFAGGVSYYGVTDLKSLASSTHKFETDYLNTLLGSLPDAENIYAQRSPLYNAKNITTPVLFLHGRKDKVVPLAQMLNITAAIHHYHPDQVVEVEIYSNEGHGFRDPRTISHALEREYAFYRQLLL